jgi:hypothetical protein
MIPRPERTDDAVVDIAFEKIWPSIKKWVGHTEDDEDTRNAAKKVLKNAYGQDDGYQLARYFEDESFMPDSDLVEILDGWGSHLYHAHQEVIKSWAKENPITPRFKVGDIVTFEAGQRFASKMLNDGEIIVVNLDLQVYTINSASAGHIKPNSGKCGITGCFANFEVLHAQNPVKESTDVQPA